MSQTLDATFDGVVFRPVQAVELQPDTQVQLIVTVKSTPAEKPKSFLSVARSLELSGPADWSSRLDHTEPMGWWKVPAVRHF
ncbi:MAG: hypothetical protein Q8K78_02640 [Planctomycetaceae bacterium]|nr:hypothetical protein [Planctomycetaceae bacterium]